MADEAPATALCVAGAARTFASPLVASSIRSHLIHALGDRVRLFLHLKTADTAKHLGPSRMAFAAHTVTLKALQDALCQPWLAQLVEEAVIVNGSGSATGGGVALSGAAVCGQGGVPPPRVAVQQGNASAWRVLRATRCSLSAYLAAGANQQRMLLNHLGQAWCRGAVLRAEARMAHPFDLIAFAN